MMKSMALTDSPTSQSRCPSWMSSASSRDSEEDFILVSATASFHDDTSYDHCDDKDIPVGHGESHDDDVNSIYTPNLVFQSTMDAITNFAFNDFESEGTILDNEPQNEVNESPGFTHDFPTKKEVEKDLLLNLFDQDNIFGIGKNNSSSHDVPLLEVATDDESVGDIHDNVDDIIHNNEDAYADSDSSSNVVDSLYDTADELADQIDLHARTKKTPVLSKKKRRKQLQLAKRAAAAAAAAAAFTQNMGSMVTNTNIMTQSIDSKHPSIKMKHQRLKNRRHQIANIAVACATESIASYREECLWKSKK